MIEQMAEDVREAAEAWVFEAVRDAGHWGVSYRSALTEESRELFELRLRALCARVKSIRTNPSVHAAEGGVNSMVAPYDKRRVEWQSAPHGWNRRGHDTGGTTPMPDNPNAYEEAANALLRETGCTVRKWRKNNTGTAYTKSADWGIEAPRPREPISFVVFAHEVGHQDMHRHNSAPRWLEEIEAWEYALAQFDRFELDGRDKAEAQGAASLRYAAHKASLRCSAKTANAILDRMPDWVDRHEDDPRKRSYGVWERLLSIVEGNQS